MSKHKHYHNYQNYQNNKPVATEEVEEAAVVQEEVIEEEVVEVPEVEETVEPEVEAAPEVEETPAVEPVPTKIGVVADCSRLRVRAAANTEAEILCEIEAGKEVAIDESASTADFYKVCTETGIEGYCMKKFIKI